MIRGNPFLPVWGPLCFGLLLGLGACVSSLPPVADTDSSLDAGDSPSPDGPDGGESTDAGPVIVDAGTPEPTIPDPFLPRPDSTEGLTNIASDLSALLENGTLPGACTAWEQDPSNREKRLRCGKAMFFYEGFDTVGVPAPIFDFFGQEFEEELGLGFSAYGVIPDPYSDINRPLGFVPGAPLRTSMLGIERDVETVAFTCASCHFGQLPDGRYAVGAPNHNYEYGNHILALLLAPSSAGLGFREEDHHPDAIEKIRPVLDRLDSSNGLKIRLGIDLLPLLGAQDETPLVSYEDEGHYAHWLSGTMDFMMAPLPLDDTVHTVSKIISLWDIPAEDEEESYDMPHAMLSWSGGAQSVMQFLRGFVAIGDGADDAWPDERLAPLAEYIISLRAPEPLSAPDATLVAEGRDIFFGAGQCIDCHAGPRGGGQRLYTFEEIGTDDAMRAWGDPELDGELCCGLGAGEPTHGIKSPRLNGLFAQTRFLHNGSVSSLEELLCYDGPRDPIEAIAFGNAGHEFGCDDLTQEDKDALLAFLRSL